MITPSKGEGVENTKQIHEENYVYNCHIELIWFHRNNLLGHFYLYHTSLGPPGMVVGVGGGWIQPQVLDKKGFLTNCLPG